MFVGVWVELLRVSRARGSWGGRDSGVGCRKCRKASREANTTPSVTSWRFCVVVWLAALVCRSSARKNIHVRCVVSLSPAAMCMARPAATRVLGGM